MVLIKKLFQTILILIGIAILVALLGAGIMMIGHVDLFGYSFISLNYSTDTVGNEFDVAALTKIDIDTSNIDIAIATTTGTEIHSREIKLSTSDAILGKTNNLTCYVADEKVDGFKGVIVKIVEGKYTYVLEK